MLLSPAQLVEQARLNIEEIEIEMLSDVRRPQDLVIDVREVEERSVGFITESICVPRGLLEMKIAELLGEQIADAANDNEAPRIFLYCRSGARSVLAAESLVRMGLPRVTSLKGGFVQWQRINPS